MSIRVIITNDSDSFGLATATVKAQDSCPHCGHRPQPREQAAQTIHPRDSSVRIIQCGEKLVLEALHDDGVPSGTY